MCRFVHAGACGWEFRRKSSTLLVHSWWAEKGGHTGANAGVKGGGLRGGLILAHLPLPTQGHSVRSTGLQHHGHVHWPVWLDIALAAVLYRRLHCPRPIRSQLLLFAGPGILQGGWGGLVWCGVVWYEMRWHFGSSLWGRACAELLPHGGLELEAPLRSHGTGPWTGALPCSSAIRSCGKGTGVRSSDLSITCRGDHPQPSGGGGGVV